MATRQTANQNDNSKMNKDTAIKKGYHSTGFYSRHEGDMATKCDEIKARGYKALVVTVPDHPNRRGPVSRGYAVVVEERHVNDERANRCLAELGRQQAAAQRIMQEAQAELDQLNERNHANEAWLKANGYNVATPALKFVATLTH